MRKAAVWMGLWLAVCAAGLAQVISESVVLGAEAVPVVRLERVASGLNQPVQVTYAPGDLESLFVVEKPGRIVRVVRGRIDGEPLLDLQGQVSGGSEQGLLSVAFHPRFEENRTFFVYYTDRQGAVRIVRYRTFPGRYVADPDSRIEVLVIPQPAANHNGGMMAFGPDGYLYIGTGDGGRAGDPWGNAQNLSTLLGKLLRIDVDGGEPYAIPAGNPFAARAGARPEIWAYGLRNPWRFSFDRETGGLYIADVGQDQWEEINYAAPTSRGGENYGWNIMEGRHCFRPRSGCRQSGLVLPVAEYHHAEEQACSITGGYVYRGSRHPELRGLYFFGDYCSGRIYAMETPGSDWDGEALAFDRVLDTSLLISSFGEDAEGEVYVVDLRGGEVYRIAL